MCNHTHESFSSRRFDWAFKGSQNTVKGRPCLCNGCERRKSSAGGSSVEPKNWRLFQNVQIQVLENKPETCWVSMNNSKLWSAQGYNFSPFLTPTASIHTTHFISLLTQCLTSYCYDIFSAHVISCTDTSFRAFTFTIIIDYYFNYNNFLRRCTYVYFKNKDTHKNYKYAYKV